MTEPTTTGAPPNRLPLILGIGAGVLLLIFLLSQLLGGDDDTEPATTPPPVTAVPVVPTPTTVAPGDAPAETFETFNTKNPFVPLRIVGAGAGTGGGGGAGATPPAGGAAPGGGAVAPGGGTAPGATGPGGATTGATGATGAAGAPGTGTGRTAGGGTEPRRGARVALLDVFASDGRTVANVRVNDTVYKVSDGQVFATNFKVVSLSQADECGRFVFGDDAFQLCKGEETLK